MGLTIHYDVQARQVFTPQAAQALVQKMRVIAQKYPFDAVGDLKAFQGEDCGYEKHRAACNAGEFPGEDFWLLIQAGCRLTCPWNKHIRSECTPERIYAFTIDVGPGSEPINIGLTRLPDTIPVVYRVRDDIRFWDRKKMEFSWDKYSRHIEKKRQEWRKNPVGDPPAWFFPEQIQETRQVATESAGWTWGSFCKTQYASDPAEGGVPNFLRCHISAILFLEELGKLPELKVAINDEGKFGRSHYAENWRDPKPSYRWHKGKHDPRALAEEVGSWNEMIATMAGAFKDALGNQFEAPILGYSNFEQLEFRGQNRQELLGFAQSMGQFAQELRKTVPAETS